jgi:hypothetical protein
VPCGYELSGGHRRPERVVQAGSRPEDRRVAALEKAGQPMPTVDSQIAATARRHGLTLVTRNEEDFRHGGVRLLNPFES